MSEEIGQTIANRNGVRCECGKQGCLQKRLRVRRWLIQNVRKLYELNTSPLLRLLADTPDDISIDTIANAYDLGDEAVTEDVTNAMRYLGIATSKYWNLDESGKNISSWKALCISEHTPKSS